MVSKAHFLAITIAVFFFDRLTKLSIITNLQLHESITIFPFFSLTRVHNYGIAWGFLQGSGIVSILVSILVILLIVYNFQRIFEQKKQVIIGISLILAGATGNLVDRLLYGYVVDFLNFHIWPVFNIADCALVLGTILFILQKEQKSQRKTLQKTPSAEKQD
ncbi:signal peptidase II [Candidatus Woesearchaeota archaeon]|nr:MAG: signal peptidase II [Candidatus Woesearchaeota archaeon]